jgi:hypothetical protein
MNRVLALVALTIVAAGCGGASAASTSMSAPVSTDNQTSKATHTPSTYTKADAFVDINSTNKKTFCRALNWDMGFKGFMSYNMVKGQYVRAGYGTAAQFDAKNARMNCPL